MADKIISVFSIVMVSLTLTNLVVSDDATVDQNGSIGNLSCADKGGGSGVDAANCTNGRGLFGCCVDRARCDYNTTNIDLTLYATEGRKAFCTTTLVCCPIEYVLAANNTVENAKQDDDDDDTV